MSPYQRYLHKILIIDEYEFVRLLYKLEFEEEGYDVAVAASAREGMRQMECSVPDVIVADVKRSDTNILQALHQIAVTHPWIPVIINSAYGHLHEDDGAPHASEYVLKSSDLHELKASVRNACARGACRSELNECLPKRDSLPVSLRWLCGGVRKGRTSPGGQTNIALEGCHDSTERDQQKKPLCRSQKTTRTGNH